MSLCVHNPGYFKCIGVDRESLQKEWPFFWDSTRKASIKTHRFQHRVARHIHNFLHICNTQTDTTIIDMAKNIVNCQPIISLFQLTNIIGSFFNYLLVLLIYIYSHISSDFSSATLFCAFLCSLCVPDN